MRRSSHLQGKAVPSFLSYFMTLTPPNKINTVLITKDTFFITITVIFFTLFKAGFLPKQRNENWKTAGMYTSTSASNTVNKEITIWLAEVMIITSNMSHSDFIANHYCESWDSSYEKSWVWVQNQWVPDKKKKSPKCLGLYVIRQFIWRQTPKLCIISVYLSEIKIYSFYFKAQQRLKEIAQLNNNQLITASKITQTGYLELQIHSHVQINQ